MSRLSELVEAREAASQELRSILHDENGNERTDLSAAEETRSDELLAVIDELDPQIESETGLEKRRQKLAEAKSIIDAGERSARKQSLVEEARGRTSASDARVVDEPMVYGPNSENSYFADLARIDMHRSFTPQHQDAAWRLQEWSHQVEREIADGSKAGRKAEKQFREHYREGGIHSAAKIREARARGGSALEHKRELRTGITTGGGATASASGGGGAAFVSPVFLLDDYAPYREFGRAFTDQCNTQPLPDYGMDIYIPAVQGAAGIASQTEASSVNETDPTFGYLSTALITEAGQVTVSQQLLDRAGPGFAFDRMIYDQLARDYHPKVDTYVLTQALANAGSVTYTASSFALTTTSGTTGSFYSKVAQAKGTIRTTAGTVLNPTHLFLQPNRWEFISAWGDGSGRPVVVPDYAGAFNAAAAGSPDGDEGVEGNTGYRMNGLRVFTDANIPTPGTGADQALVGDLNEVYVFEGTPVVRSLPQTLAGNLQVILQMYGYLGVIVRYQSGVQTIKGTGMTGITF